ncbi:uncharacterized protein LTR77_008789 [Saxophila tyrrhenica]|uniref:EKC/KEOPS complex subunit CGI121 n=1 Tax=Saxophila tyrrhenica TaxID=1690608 RepID=A0AAV9P3Y3_9PEZI|nr:hypothetical protein LTR77_008789 [Saxophila tyrrhenica]
MESITLPHLLDHPLRVCLFKHVQNATFLRQQLLDGNTDFEYAFLDASVLISRNHVLAACFRAINDMLNDRLKSRNVHSEIVFSLSPNNNIAESFRRFGISNESTHVLAIKVGGDAAQIEAHLTQNVQGQPAAFSDEVLAELCDLNKIRKIYRIQGSAKGSETMARTEAEAFALGSMALKGS